MKTSPNRHIQVLLFISILVLASCAGEDECALSGFSTISYGTSFGNCEGYCIKEIHIQENMVNFQKTAHNNKSTYPDFACDDIFPGFEGLKSEISLNDFCKMAGTIGCPDCTDQGAEWVEISNGAHALRVTFEHNNAPGEFINFIENLRFYLQRMEASC